MKAISFSAVEILPALLDKSKTQTIRPAFYKDNRSIYQLPKATHEQVERFRRALEQVMKSKKKAHIVTDQKVNIVPLVKPARFKKGDEVKLYWKQRSSSKDAMFCWKCGEELVYGVNARRSVDSWFCPKHTSDFSFAGTAYALKLRTSGFAFPKLLGTVKITEVFRIEMCSSKDASLIKGMSYQQLEEMAKLDGFRTTKFSDPIGFVKYFIDNYDLSSEKKFWVYRWKW